MSDSVSFDVYLKQVYPDSMHPLPYSKGELVTVVVKRPIAAATRIGTGQYSFHVPTVSVEDCIAMVVTEPLWMPTGFRYSVLTRYGLSTIGVEDIVGR